MRLIAILAALALSTAAAAAECHGSTPVSADCVYGNDASKPLCLRPGDPPGCVELKIDGVPVSELERNWHLLTISNGGTVSLVKDLTKHECEFAMHRAKGEPATEEEVKSQTKERLDRVTKKLQWDIDHKDCVPTGWTCHDNYCQIGEDCHNPYGWSIVSGTAAPGDIKSAECFQ